MTLLEVLLAISVLAVLVVLMAGILRVGLRGWEAGQRQADAQQEVRAVVELVTEALAGAYPYRGTADGGLERSVLFDGTPDEVRFVTTAPPVGLDAPAAPFHAVVLGRDGEDRLRVTERLVPADAPFTNGTATTLSRAVTTFRLYYKDESGAWLDSWDGKSAAGIPTAVRVDLVVRPAGRRQAIPSLLVPLPLGKESTG
jgi:general secretion pathway protein J